MLILHSLLLLIGCFDPASDNNTVQEKVITGDAPTVVVVIACTMRADRLHTYGNPLNTSPYIDNLADNGVKFTRTLTSAPWTRPGVAALMTGRFPLGIGIDSPTNNVNTNRGLHPDIDTMAERFKRAGYTTIGAIANPNANAIYNFDQGFDTYHEASGLWRDEFHKAEGVDVVDSWLSIAATVDGPLFGQLLVIDTHTPLASLPDRRQKLGLPAGQGNMLERYDAAVTVLDDVVAHLDAGLEKIGRKDRLLVFIADHSEGLKHPEHAGAAHGRWLYEANLHIPWIMHGPGIASGHTIDGLSTSVDLLPTLLDLSGLPLGGQLDGLSHANAVRGHMSQTNHSFVYSETRFANETKARITTPNWSYIHNLQPGKSSFKRGKKELYAHTDRTQLHNIVTKHPLVTNTFDAQLTNLRAQIESESIYWTYETNNTQDDDLTKQLEALGYVE